jgi:hypothetical protein
LVTHLDLRKVLNLVACPDGDLIAILTPRVSRLTAVTVAFRLIMVAAPISGLAVAVLLCSPA